MAASDARPVPRKNAPYRVVFPILDADGDLVSAAADLDSEVSKDAAAPADCVNEATEIGSSGMYYLDLTAAEMNADCVVVLVKTSTDGAKTTPIVLYPEEAGDIRANVTQASEDCGLATAAALAAATGNVEAVKAKTDNLPASPAAVGSAMTLNAAERDNVADAVLARSVAHVEAAAGEHTLCTIVLAMLEGAVSGSTWTIRRTDGATTHATKTVTSDPDANPITGVA